MKVLLVEPWFTGSHRAWAEGYQASSALDIRLATLPGERWRWRLRAGAIELGPVIDELVSDGWRPDLMLVSGIVDVAALAGLLGDRLGAPAIVVYQHESQMVYPNQSGAIDIDSSLRNIASWLAADGVLFGSDYHRSAVLDALAMRSHDLGAEVCELAVAALQERSAVLNVGVDVSWAAVGEQPSRVEPWILWPHRWDWDKRPDVFLRALRKLAEQTPDFRLVLAGADGAESSIRDEIVKAFPDQVAAVGPFDFGEYRRLVSRCDLVVSCAVHEFFGIGVVEALAADCVGVLPNRLSYPEIVGAAGGHMLYQDQGFGAALAEAVAAVHAGTQVSPIGDEVRAAFGWDTLAPLYDDKLCSLCPDGETL